MEDFDLGQEVVRDERSAGLGLRPDRRNYRREVVVCLGCGLSF